MGLLAANVGGGTNAGWLIAAVTVGIPLIVHINASEREQAEEQKRLVEEATRSKEAQERRQIQEDVNDAYNVLKELPDNVEAMQLCRDCEEFYWNEEMEPEIRRAFESRITRFAKPYIEARELEEQKKEELRLEKEEQQELPRQAENEAKNQILRQRYLSSSGENLDKG